LTLATTLTSTKTLIGHGIAGDIAQLAEAGLPLKEGWVTGVDLLDSLLLARMVNENGLKGAYELESLLLQHVITDPWKHETKAYDFKEIEVEGKLRRIEDVDARRWPVDLRRKRCRLDSWASYVLARQLYPKLHPQRPLVTFTHRIASLLSRVNLAGAVVDLTRFEAMGAELEATLVMTRDQLGKAAIAAGKESFHPTNDDDLRSLLYDHLGLPVLARTSKTKKPSVDQDTLKQLDHPAVTTLLAFNKADKTFGVNVTGLRALLHPCGRIGEVPVAWLPFRINPLGAKTGRRSSSNPNSQNWPPAVRSIIRSRWPGGSVADLDYRKLEPRLFGWVAKDDKLFSFFTTGKGYIDVAAELFGAKVQEGTPRYKAVKSIVLAVHYNRQPKGMAESLRDEGLLFSPDWDWHLRETTRIRALYLKRFKGIARYIQDREDELLANGFVTSLTGQARHLPVPDGRRTPGYSRLLNQAINFPIQRLASDVTGSAMLDAEEDLLAESGMSYVEYLEALVKDRRKLLTTNPLGGIMTPTIEHALLINEVHDSLVSDMFPSTCKRDLEIFVENMRSVRSLRSLCPTFTMPLDVDVKLGSFWGQKG